ncbi:FmdB family zinc ribbon protein [Pseudomarimonas salicorniae]|uniref:Zinc ribbon domain-containing protein n=1 Tax=Pseudomarimonas salicorniae TaxID=2933270 RepID=A0ABT0GGJ3_9GAMM|nr:zinc ribbon domain-containing protein [Lysobacter sp. CAU 1642]MCK7593663.1 zinc ribbon domain-containing protein [Lysobacter sp. CAU 1642]
MPIYTYRSTGTGCAHCREGFDTLQKLSDAELNACPECGAAVRKQLSAPALAIGGAHLLSEKRIGEKGFTQYRKIGKGVYEKTAGKGPDIIQGD